MKNGMMVFALAAAMLCRPARAWAAAGCDGYSRLSLYENTSKNNSSYGISTLFVFEGFRNEMVAALDG